MESTSEGPSAVLLVKNFNVEDDKETVKNTTKNADTILKQYQCSICPKTFAKATYLKLHMRTHTGERPYICKTCSKSFYDQAGLQRHSLIHTDTKPFNCNQCGKGFRQKCDMKKHAVQHLNKTEIDESSDLYKCKDCGAGFQYRGYLRTHIAESHEKNFKCKHCAKILSSTSALRLHTRLHTGDRPFKCPHCPKSYTSGYQMRIHVMSHTGNKPIKCDLCEKTFISQSRMKIHRATHERSTLGVPRRRKRKEQETLKKHFICDTCGQKFALEFSLNLHNEMLHGDTVDIKTGSDETLPLQNTDTLIDTDNVVGGNTVDKEISTTAGK